MIQKSFGQRKLQIKKLNQLTRLRKPAVARPVEVDLFDLCRSCACSSSKKQWEEAQSCCPVCGFHTRISSLKRIPYLLDDDYESISPPAAFVDPLDFPGYEKKWQEAAENSGVDEAVSFYWGSMEGSPLILGVMDPFFMMGSMGSIVGERIVAAFDLAAKKDLPVVIVACSGGARMQESIVSLMQMRRTAAAVSRHRQAGRLFISVLTDPTTGGVTASFASLGDIILAEPGALIGFAGPRVIKETIQCDLPQGFQSAEFQEKHGFVDRIVERTELIGHLNKATGQQSGYRGLGSIDFTAGVRSVLVIGKSKDDPNLRIMAHDKSSLAPAGTSLAFLLGDEEGFRWVGDFDISAEELLSGLEKKKESKTKEAKDLMCRMLTGGKDVFSEEIDRAALEKGISSRTVRDAKKELGDALKSKIGEGRRKVFWME